MVQAMHQVTQELKHLDRCSCPVAHDLNMVGPVEVSIEEEAQVAQSGGG